MLGRSSSFMCCPVVPVRFVKFQDVRNIALFVVDNVGGDDTSAISAIALQGCCVPPPLLLRLWCGPSHGFRPPPGTNLRGGGGCASQSLQGLAKFSLVKTFRHHFSPSKSNNSRGLIYEVVVGMCISMGTRHQSSAGIHPFHSFEAAEVRKRH